MRTSHSNQSQTFYLQLSHWASQILNLQRKKSTRSAPSGIIFSELLDGPSSETRLFYGPSQSSTAIQWEQEPEAKKLSVTETILKTETQNGGKLDSETQLELEMGNQVEEGKGDWESTTKSLWLQNYVKTMCVCVHLTPPSGQEALSVFFTDFLFFQSLVFLCGVCSTSGCAVGTSILEWNWYFPLSGS